MFSRLRSRIVEHVWSIKEGRMRGHAIIHQAGLAFLVVVCSALPAIAQPDPGDIGIYMDPLGAEPTGVAVTFVPFDVYVLGFDLPGGVQAYEYSVHIPPFFTVLESVFPDGVNVGSDLNVIFALAECLDRAGVLQLQRLRMISVVPGAITMDMVVCIGASTPSSLANMPSWLDCTGTLNEFGVAQEGGPYPNGCLILNPTLPCCPTSHFELPLRDTLVPPGAAVRVPFAVDRVWDTFCAPVDPAASWICNPAIAHGLRFDVEFDPQLLGWDGVEGAGMAGLPIATTQTGPGVVHVELGWYVDPAWITSLERVGDGILGTLGFTLAPAGGTTEVFVRNIEGFDEMWAEIISVRDQSFLISDDPAVATENASFGSLKARY
jgi:hypothetical protein